MACGDKQLYNQQQGQQLAWNSGLLHQALGENTAAYNSLMPQLQSILAHPGYSDADKQAMLDSMDSALGGAYGDVQNQLAGRAALTGNSAGIIPAEEELGRAKARAMGQAAGSLAQSFANAALGQQDYALNSLSGLYRNSQPLISSGLGSSTNLIGQQGRLAGIPGAGTQLLQGGINAGLGLLSGLGIG